MKVNYFKPTSEIAEALEIGNLVWIYDTGEEIVKEFGNVFEMRLIPDTHYLITSKGDEIDMEDLFLCSNKLDYQMHPNTRKKFLERDSFKFMHGNRYNGAQITDINGVKGILTFPFSSKCAFVYEPISEIFTPIISTEYKDVNGADEIYKNMEEAFGDCSELFNVSIKPEIKKLDCIVCGEFASTSDVEYVIAYGWELVKYYSDKIDTSKLNRRVRYLVMNVKNSGKKRTNYFSDKWLFLNHSKIEGWMKENGAHKKMFADIAYSGMPCNLNGHKIIVCFPFLKYNPVIWDIEDDTVTVLPSKPYQEKKEYTSILKKYGEIY